MPVKRERMFHWLQKGLSVEEAAAKAGVYSRQVRWRYAKQFRALQKEPVPTAEDPNYPPGYAQLPSHLKTTYGALAAPGNRREVIDDLWELEPGESLASVLQEWTDWLQKPEEERIRLLAERADQTPQTLRQEPRTADISTPVGPYHHPEAPKGLNRLPDNFPVPEDKGLNAKTVAPSTVPDPFGKLIAEGYCSPAIDPNIVGDPFARDDRTILESAAVWARYDERCLEEKRERRWQEFRKAQADREAKGRDALATPRRKL